MKLAMRNHKLSLLTDTAESHRLCWLSGFGSGTDRTAWP